MRSPRSALLGVCLAAVAVTGCASRSGGPQLPPAAFVQASEGPGDEYVVGPLDQLSVFVWRNPELSAKVQVRPDGRITTPLIPDMPAVGKTSAQLAEDIKAQLTHYIRDPIVTVTVESSVGTFSQQVRVVGATAKPASIPFRANMTLLDAMIAVGGLSEFAAGDRARLVRFDKVSGRQTEYALRIGRLLKQGDASANVRLQPGDVIIIPTSAF